jgi:hypothetical protein
VEILFCGFFCHKKDCNAKPAACGMPKYLNAVNFRIKPFLLNNDINIFILSPNKTFLEKGNSFSRKKTRGISALKKLLIRQKTKLVFSNILLAYFGLLN